MRHEDHGTDFLPALSDVAGLLRDFPGRVAVADTAMGYDVRPDWEPVCYGNAEQHEVMLSIRALHRRAGEHDGLWVTTARSPRGLTPRGLPAEDAATQITNLLVCTGQADGSGTAPIELMLAVRDEVAAATRSAVAVAWDGAEVAGHRIDVRGCALVELPGDHEGVVLCVAAPEVIDGLVLRTAAPADFPPRFHGSEPA